MDVGDVKKQILTSCMPKACYLINSIQDRRSQCGVKRINFSVMRAGGTLLDCASSSFLLSCNKRKEAKEKNKAAMKKLKNNCISLKSVNSQGKQFISYWIINRIFTKKNVCCEACSNSTDFLTLYSVIFLHVFSLNAENGMSFYSLY